MSQIKKTRHLVYSPSAAGSLRYIIKNKNILNQEVISINDDLSYGPLNDIKKRLDFIANLIDDIATNDKELKEYVEAAITSWPKPRDFKDYKLIIWHSKNAPEQLMLQMIAKQLQNLELHEIALENDVSSLRGAGEFTPEKLGSFLGTETTISTDRKNKLIKTWDDLLLSEGILRIWKDQTVTTDNETYYDNELMKQCSNVFLNAARIVGAVLGRSEQMVSDTWLNYRIIQLIKKNKILAKGDTKQLRTFEIRIP